MKHVDDATPRNALLGLAAGMLAVILIPELTQAGFYFADDVRHYFMPLAMEIGQRLSEGEMPWMTLRTWFAGNILGDGLMSLLNPINLFLYWLASRIGDPQAAALTFAGTYLFLTALGVFALARAYQVPRRWAVVAALAYCSSAYVMYWHASSWWNQFIGTCWMIWAWAGWRNFLREGSYGLVAFIGTYFLLISGWPQGAVMAVLIVVVELFFARDRFIVLSVPAGRRGAIIHGSRLAAVIGLGMCAIGASLLSNYPAYIHAADSARSNWGLFRGGNWTGSLDYLIAAGWPSYLAVDPAFFDKESSFPVFYLAWFVPPALLLLFSRSIRSACAPRVQPLLAIAAVAVLITLGPEQIYMLRWPLRFLTFAHIALVLAACIVLPNIDLKRRIDRLTVLGYVLVGAVVSIQVDPESLALHLQFLALVLIAVGLATFRQPSTGPRPLPIVIVMLVTELCFHFNWPRNLNVGQWQVPSTPRPVAQQPVPANSRAVLMPMELPCDSDCLFASGNIGLWEPGRALNGYTPVGQRAYHSTLGFNLWSWSLVPEFVAAYFAEDPGSGKRLHELMRLEEFRVARGELLDRFNEASKGDWGIEHLAQGSVFRRPASTQVLPGTVSWATPGLRLKVDSQVTTARERLELVENGTDSSARIVFARPWYPGYSAELEGEPLKVERYARFLVSVQVPAVRSGTITLQYRPAGIQWTLPLAVLCTVLAIFITLHARRREKRH